MLVRECLDFTLEELEAKLAVIRAKASTSPLGTYTKPGMADVSAPAAAPKRGVDYWCAADLRWSKDRAALKEQFGLEMETVIEAYDAEEGKIPEDRYTQFWPISRQYPQGRIVKP